MHFQCCNSIHKKSAENTIVAGFFGSTIDCSTHLWVWSKTTKAPEWCKVPFSRYFKWICLLSLHFSGADLSLTTSIVQVNNYSDWGFLHNWAFILHHGKHFNAIRPQIGRKTPHNNLVLGGEFRWICDGRTFWIVRFSGLTAINDDWIGSSRCFYGNYDHTRSFWDDKFLAAGNGPTRVNSHGFRHL